MPAKQRRVPSYCLHKHTGQAVVRIDGRDIYLGTCGTPCRPANGTIAGMLYSIIAMPLLRL